MEINISARDIRAFRAVADTRSFSQAAKQMHLSQSALSTLILRIEEGIGARLFDRTTRSVALTAAGEILASHADQLLADIERAVAAVRDVSALRRGKVSIAVMPSIAARIVPQLFRAFRDSHPNIALSLADTLSEAAFELVREGHVDFAITAANPAFSDLDYIPLTTDSFVLLVARAHPLGRTKSAVKFNDTLSWQHISMTRHTSVRQYVDATALQHGFGFLPAFEVDHLATIGAMVAALPTMAADVINAKGLIRRPLVGPTIRRSIGIVTRRETALSPAADAMLSLLKHQISTAS